jgi:TonB family protein
MIARALRIVVVCLTIGVAGTSAQSGPTLANAKAFYDSASFDEALTVLDRLSTTQPDADVEEVQRYRALCLLALNRAAEAQRAIEIVVSRNPLYKLPEGEAPPRMRAAFADARRRLLPKATEQLYAAAKLSFDRKEYELAATQFADLLTFLDDPDGPSSPSLQEYRTLATGFRDLSIAAQTSATRSESKLELSTDPPPVTAADLDTNLPEPVPATASTSSESVPQPEGVLQPPVIIKQQMPLWLGQREYLPRETRGMMRVIIDEQGNVADARIVQSVHRIYDALLLSAARAWKYEPAILDGKPVSYMKMIEVVLKPQ